MMTKFSCFSGELLHWMNAGGIKGPGANLGGWATAVHMGVGPKTLYYSVPDTV